MYNASYDSPTSIKDIATFANRSSTYLKKKTSTYLTKPEQLSKPWSQHLPRPQYYNISIQRSQ